MATADTDIHAALRAELAHKIGDERFELWFGSHTQLRLANEMLLVEASSAFSRDWLRSHFRADIAAACRKLVGSNIAIEFRVREVEAPLKGSSSPRPPEKTSLAKIPVEPSPTDSHPIRRSDSPAERANRQQDNREKKRAVLDSFIVGDCNRLATTSARMAVEQPGKVSPLLIYGETGVGKTHLLTAIRGATRAIDRRTHAIYLTAEQFTTLFLGALNGGGLPNFRRKYRGVDLLLIDDLQFFAGKKATLVELLHTIDTLQREGRQIVFTADRSPAQLGRLGPELTARLTAGLVCPIDPPDFATRRDIVRQLCSRLEVKIPDDVQTFVASQITATARELSGALHRLQATSLAHAQPVTRTLAESALADLMGNVARLVQLPDIQRAVCDVFGITPGGLSSPRRSQSVSHPRMLAMWLARKHTRAGLSEIGEFFGRRSHSTVVSASKKVERWMSEQASMALAEDACQVEEAIRRVEQTLHIA